MLARKTYIHFMLQLMRLANLPICHPIVPTEPSSKVPSKAKTNQASAFSVVCLSSSNVVPHGSNILSFVDLPRQSSLMSLSAPRMSVPSVAMLFVGTRTSNAHTVAMEAPTRAGLFSGFSTAKVPHPHVVRLWGCVTHLHAAVGYSWCFRRKVTQFHDVLSDMSVNPGPQIVCALPKWAWFTQKRLTEKQFLS